MRKSTIFISTLAAILVSAPSLAADAEWRSVAYSCETGKNLTVAFRDSGNAVQVQDADRPAVKLVSRPAKVGFRYGDSRHELRGDGDAITWKIGSKSAVKCTSTDPLALNFAAAAAR